MKIDTMFKIDVNIKAWNAEAGTFAIFKIAFFGSFFEVAGQSVAVQMLFALKV